ncbi:hypothetical protein ACOSQ2_008311 [Xanthoceras sorbifolium]
MYTVHVIVTMTLTLLSPRGSRFRDLISTRVRESLVAVAEGEFSFMFAVRGCRGRCRERETVSETNCAPFAMADEVGFTTQMRGVRRERGSS